MLLFRRPASFVLAIAALLSSAPVSTQDRPPQFRSGVELTRVEITVLDASTRKPVTGLTAADFVVKVDGRPQPIVAFAATTASVKATTPGSSSIVEAGIDVVSNQRRERPRLFVLVMNDAAGGGDPYNRQTGKRIAHRLIDELGPDDLAAVIFTRDNRHAQDFTADRSLLRQAVDRFDPMTTAGIQPLQILARAYRFLQETPGYRRALVFVSPVMPMPPEEAAVEPFTRLGNAEGLEALHRNLVDISTAAGVSPVPIYLFSTHGLHAPTREDISFNKGRNRDYDAHVEIFRTIAGLTGGRAVAANNAPAEQIPTVFEELSSYYTVGYENTYPNDGKRRWLEVEVGRKGVIVLPARQLITTVKPAAATASGTVAAASRDSGLVEALGSALPAGELPLRLSYVPVAVPARPEQAVVLTLGLPASRDSKDEFGVQCLVYDAEGRRELINQARQVTLPPMSGGTEGWAEVALRLNLRPGRYQVRVAAQQAGTKTSGSVYATVTVPHFSRDALSVSGVSLTRVPAGGMMGGDAVEDLLPFRPTAARTFTRTDHVGALVRVHQRADMAPVPVQLAIEVIDAAGAMVRSAVRSLPEASFDKGAGVEHRYDLPVGTLEPGSYVLRFIATAGAARVQRDVRFSVQSEVTR